MLLAGGLAVLALVRPTTDPRAPLPVAALVGLTLATGLLGALLWSPAVAALGRLTRAVEGGPPLRRTVLLARRRPLLPSVTAGFLAAALATAFLAGAWSASTARSAQDQAANLVPLDARVSPSTQVQLPATVVDQARLAAVAPGVVVAPVTSTVVSAFVGSVGAVALPLTGLDPDVLPLVHRWSAVTGSDRSAAEVAGLLRTPAVAAPAPVVPAGTRRLVLDVRGLDPDVTLGVWVAGPDGQERQLRLTQRGDQAYADLPAGPALDVRALEIGESADHITHRQHGIGEGSTDRQLPAGTLRLGAVRADGVALPWSWAGWGADTVDVRPLGSDGSGLEARYRILDARAVLLPSWVPGRGTPGAAGGRRRGDGRPGGGPRHLRPHGQPGDGARPRRRRAPPDAHAGGPLRARRPDGRRRARRPHRARHGSGRPGLGRGAGRRGGGPRGAVGFRLRGHADLPGGPRPGGSPRTP